MAERQPITVSGVELTHSAPPDALKGLLGWLRFDVNGALRLDGVALRRTREGTIALTFPARRDRQGRDHPLVRPLDSEARAAIERQVLAALGLDEGATP